MKHKLTIQHDISHKEGIPAISTTLQISVIQWMAVLVLLMTVSCGPPPPRATVNQTPTTGSTEENSEVETIQEMDAAYFIHEIMNSKRLATYIPGERTKTITSHDPNNGPVDAGFILDTYEENGTTWNILVEEDGPGVLTRMFFTHGLEGRIRIFLDYQNEPVIDTTFQEMYELKSEFFQLYLTSVPAQSAGGFTSYFPIPYASHITVMTDSKQEALIYQFDLLSLPSDSPVKTFNGKTSPRLTKAIETHNAYLESNAVARNEKTVLNGFVSHTLKSGETKLIINDPGPGALSFFAVQIDPLSIDALEKTRIKMYWDDMTEAAVDTSLRDFFCANIGVPSNWNSTAMGYYPQTDSFPNGFYYCQFYMPFQSKGQVILENTSDQTVTYQFARTLDFSAIPDDFLYFFSRSDQRTFALGLIYSLFEFEGKGKFAGFQISTAMDKENTIKPINFFYTGDPYYFVDGEEYASIVGSGLDNYFNGSNLLQEGTPFWMPTHGTLYNTVEPPQTSHSYRFHLLDAIQFSTSLFYVQEIGCPIQYVSSSKKNTLPTQGRWTCYWYAKKADSEIKRKEKVHYYSINGNPNPSNPVIIDLQVYLQLPPGQWNLKYAPIYNLSEVFQQEYNIAE